MGERDFIFGTLPSSAKWYEEKSMILYHQNMKIISMDTKYDTSTIRIIVIHVPIIHLRDLFLCGLVSSGLSWSVLLSFGPCFLSLGL